MHEVLCLKLKDTAGVSLTYHHQQQQASDSAYSNDTLNPTPPVTFSSQRQRVLSFLVLGWAAGKKLGGE